MARLLLKCRCGHTVKVPGNSLGRRWTCVKCGKKLTVTETNAEPIEGEVPTRPHVA
ncbi:MAG: hypothetical protein QG656_906, partial [Candidatus Hydrogenedentes bacterium]|nr:hypothetical protein [Candidatus Hydrogenedentota bacterium]